MYGEFWVDGGGGYGRWTYGEDVYAADGEEEEGGYEREEVEVV